MSKISALTAWVPTPDDLLVFVDNLDSTTKKCLVSDIPGTVTTDATLTTSNITTNDVSTTKHGFAPKAPNDATKFLNGLGAYSVPAGWSGTVTSVTSANADATVATTTTTPVITIVSAPKLTTARTIGWTSFDGTANIAVALAGTVTTNANLTGDVTSIGNATTLTNAPVIAKVLTGYVSGAGTVASTDTILQAIQKLNGNTAAFWSGTVTSVSVTTANGVSGTVATATTTPAISLTLGAITPTSIVASSTVAGSNLSGTNTGDNTVATALTGTPSITVNTVTTTGNIELGHASDTTISRVSAGKIAVEGVNIGNEGILQISQSAAYTLVLADAGKHIYHPSADTTARTWTIPANASVAYPIGTALTFMNDTSAGVITIAITTDVMVLAGAGTTGSRTLAANGVATAIKMTATRWMISGTNLT